MAPPEEDELEEDIGADRKRTQTSRTRDGMQFEVKTLVDHKKRLRKRFWKLQEELRKKR
jgi:chaperonin cofactor prefoldin